MNDYKTKKLFSTHEIILALVVLAGSALSLIWPLIKYGHAICTLSKKIDENNAIISRALNKFSEHLINSSIEFIIVMFLIIAILFWTFRRFCPETGKRVFTLVVSVLKSITVIAGAISLIEVSIFSIGISLGATETAYLRSYNFEYATIIFPIMVLLAEFTFFKDIQND